MINMKIKTTLQNVGLLVTAIALSGCGDVAIKEQRKTEYATIESTHYFWYQDRHLGGKFDQALEHNDNFTASYTRRGANIAYEDLLKRCYSARSVCQQRNGLFVYGDMPDRFR